MDPPPETAVQVAFTAPGLAALGLAPAALAAFSPEFLSGMADPSRARRLGDVDANDPSGWDWGRADDVPHALVMFFAKQGSLDALVETTTRGHWNAAFETPRWLRTANLDGVEPFGFADGMSQPEVDWKQERDPSKGRLDYSNVVALGEFLLGYRNEYGKYTDRPILDAGPATAGLPPAADAPDKKDLGRNGTYLVFRQLRQDVRGFWRFVNGQAGGDPAAAETLAAAFVGRTRAGEPLVRIRPQPIPGVGPDADQVRLNQFTYEDDASGARCPFGAHIRRANPRNTDYPDRPTGLKRIVTDLGFRNKGFRDDLVSSVRFHRILRRGREYGPGLAPADALAPAPPGEPERGLQFVCLNANICRQFEFLQNGWIASTTFAGLRGESDPLLGNRAKIQGCPATDGFTLQHDGGAGRRVQELPQFVTVRGGAYFFLPGLRALRYIAGA
jgi:deferrochelatase/peroxidase EfeB